MKRGLGILSVLVLFSIIMLPFGECIAAEGGLRYSISVAKFKNRSNWRGLRDTEFEGVQAIVENFAEDLREHLGETPLPDDVTLIALRVED